MTKHISSALAVVISLGLYLVATSAFYPLDFLSVYDAKRVLQLVLFVGLMVFACTWSPLRKSTIAQLNRLSNLQIILSGLFFLIGVVSSLRLDHPGYALLDVSMLFVMLILVFVTAGNRDLIGKNFDRWAVGLLSVMGFAVAFQELVGFFTGWISGFEFNYDIALVHFGHPRFYNHLQTWTIPIIAALPLLFPEKRWIKPTCITLLGLQWFMVIAYGARGTTVGLTTAMVFIAFWLPAQRKYWVKYQIGGLMVGLLIYSGTLFVNDVLTSQAETGKFYAQSVGRPMMHTSGRTTLWRLSLEEAIENPWFGSGPTRYACDSDLTLPAATHSFPVGILGEWGFIAFALFLYLAMTIGISFIRKLKHTQSDHAAGDPSDDTVAGGLRAIVSISIIAGSIHACVSGLLVTPASQTTMILIASWALSLTKPIHKSKKPMIASTVLMSALLCAGLQLTFAISEISYFPARIGDTLEPVRLAPRFWWVGRTCDYRYAVRK